MIVNKTASVRLDEVLAGHEALRATFSALNGGAKVKRYVAQSIDFYPIDDYTDEELAEETALLPFRSVEDQVIVFLVQYEEENANG